MRIARALLLSASVFALTLSCACQQSSKDSDWRAYGNDPGGSRYAYLSQINKENVQQLQVSWTYRTGDFAPDKPLHEKAAFESTPIVVDGTMYLTTPYDKVIALDPATGKERWRFDPKLNLDVDYSEVSSRGVSTWVDTKSHANAPCHRTIYVGTIDARLIALDAKTGALCAKFGTSGVVDLKKGFVREWEGQYQVTSPPAIAGDVLIVGSAVGDNRAVDVEPGTVRGFDARTGKQLWSWNPIAWAEKQKLRTGAANAWAPISVDEERGLVFIPTGSAAPDFYGGERLGDNQWANSVVALKSKTGEFV